MTNRKVIKATLIYVVFLISIMIGNNLGLMYFHDLDYYYSVEGLKIAAIVAGVEAIVILPLSKLLYRKVMGDEEFYKVFGEKEDES